MTWALLALVALLGSALFSLVVGRRPRLAAGGAAIGVVVAAALALPSIFQVLRSGDVATARVGWAEPVGELRIGLDPLTAFFAVPLLVLAALCAVYGAFYLDAERARRRVEVPAALFNVLVGSMLLVVLARDAVTFLIGWEVMTLASYLLITFDHHREDVRRAGWVYLIAGHLGVVALLGLFVVLGRSGAGFDFATWSEARVAGAPAVVLFALTLVAFGIKAGLVPFHVWLPEAHAAAPSHVSALMSGMLIKVGLYGILRTLTFLAPAWWWGPVLAGIGSAGALVGIGLAFYQRDLKRALAYSSIENVGVILLGLGIGYWGAISGRPVMATLGFAGGLLHLWNHVLMKGLLFLGAGSVLHATGTRDLEQLGGLHRRMPRTAAMMIVGAVAVAALPPLNGFVSEWLIYRGLIEGSMGSGDGVALACVFAITGLAVVGVIATFSFVRVVGIGVLGRPRSSAAASAHESTRGMLIPMGVLAAAAVAMPLVGFLVVDTLEPVVAQLAGRSLDMGIAADGLRPIALASAALWAALLAVFAGLQALLRRRARGSEETWGCGYALPTSRMQYTARSFAHLGQGLLPRSMRPRVARTGPESLFPPAGTIEVDARDPFMRSGYEPFLDRWARRFARLRWVQQGLVNLYVLYILVAVVAALTVVAVDGRWGLP